MDAPGAGGIDGNIGGSSGGNIGGQGVDWDSGRALPRGVRKGRAGAAFIAILVYVVLVYLNPGTLFFEGDDVGIAKAAAGLAIGGLALSWLLFDRRVHIGGTVGAFIALHFAIVGASSTWSLWPSMSLNTFSEGLKFLTIYILVANIIDTPSRARAMLHVVALSTIIPAIGTIDGWSRGEHLVEGDRATWIGIFGNPNDLAYYLDVGMALALGAREITRKRWLRTGYLAAIAVMAAALLLTQSRGGLISAGVVFGLWAIRGLRRGGTTLGVLVIVALAAWIGPAATWQRAQTTMTYEEDASAQGRIDAWRTGLNVLRYRPLTGVGAGAFPLAWGEFAPGDAKEARTAHNTFVQVSAETGIPSFLLFCGAIAAVLLGLRTANAQALGTLARPPARFAFPVAAPIIGPVTGPAIGPVIAPFIGPVIAPAISMEREHLASMTRSVQVGIAAFIVCSLTGGLAYSWPIYFLLGLGEALMRICAGIAAKESTAHSGLNAASAETR